MIAPVYSANEGRYDSMLYRRCGRSGIQIPAVALGLWHNFGSHSTMENVKAMAHYAFDNGICHFDLANNYGPEYGTAEENFGRPWRVPSVRTGMSSLSAQKPAGTCGPALTGTSAPANT